MRSDNILKSSASPGVSIVIPAYNYERYLRQAIDSGLNQNYPTFEIVVVDDGSTDNTAKLVAANYRDNPRVRYIHQKNAGLPAARNTGIREAKFEFIGFLDADDQWMPNFLSRAMESFSKLTGEFAIVACRSAHVTAVGSELILKRLTPNEPLEISCRDILLKTRFSPSAVVAKRAALLENGCFDVTLRSSEDRDMWIRIAARHRVMLNPEQLVSIRLHTASMSTHADRMKVNTRKVLRKARRQKLVQQFDFGFWLRVESFAYFQTAWMYCGEKRFAKAIRDMIFSILLWPFFAKPELLNEHRFFRVRGLVRFVLELFKPNQ